MADRWGSSVGKLAVQWAAARVVQKGLRLAYYLVDYSGFLKAAQMDDEKVEQKADYLASC